MPIRLICLLMLVLMVAVPLHGMAQTPFTGTLLVGPLFAATTAVQDQIILYDVGGTRRELSFGVGDHTVWGFSPDGCHVLYTLSDETGPARIYSARLDGTDARSLVQYTDLPPEGWGAWEPHWSPDGTRIAFTLIRDSALLDLPAPQVEADRNEYRIAWIPAEGGAPTFYSISGDEHTPQWSPDGQWLAYTAYEKRVPGIDVSSTAVPTVPPPPGQTTPATPLVREADLWVVSADGETKYRLTYFNVGSIDVPRWSPDGELIGFLYSPVGNNDQFWMIANQPGSIPTQLSFQWSLILDFTWLPDSSAMLGAVRDFHGETINRLWRIPLVGNADTDATLYTEDAALSYADYPRFSADGHWLALRSAYSLALLDADAGTWSLVDPTTAGNTPPVWSPASFAGETSCP